mgnify:CR=1 FL=1|tara:strand:+ start:2396 stop:3436 length:1041 start_codon:yes stop_codon:yes gene_type:complete
MNDKKRLKILQANLEEKMFDSMILEAIDSKRQENAVYAFEKLLESKEAQVVESNTILENNRTKNKSLMAEIRTNIDRSHLISEFVYREIDGKYYKVKPMSPRISLIRQVGGSTSTSNPKLKSVKETQTLTVDDLDYTAISTPLEDQLIEISKDVYDFYLLERTKRKNNLDNLFKELSTVNDNYIALVKKLPKAKQAEIDVDILETQIKKGEYYLDKLQPGRTKFDSLKFDEDGKYWYPSFEDEDEATIKSGPIKQTPSNKTNPVLPKIEYDENLKFDPQTGNPANPIEEKKFDPMTGKQISALDNRGKNQTQVDAQQNSKLMVMQNRLEKNQSMNPSGNNIKKLYG